MIVSINGTDENLLPALPGKQSGYDVMADIPEDDTEASVSGIFFDFFDVTPPLEVRLRLPPDAG